MTLSRNPRQYTGVRPINPPNVIYADRAPTTTDTAYVKGDLWLDETGQSSYQYISGGLWIDLSDALGGNPITPFVVGPTGGYNTIQSGVNAAIAAGGGLVFVQEGTYTEDLTFTGSTNISLWGSGQGTVLIGNQTPPEEGSLDLRNLVLRATSGDAIASAEAGTASLRLIDIIFEVTSGAAIDIPSWTGDLFLEGIQDNSTASVFDIGSGDFLMRDSSLGTNAAGTNTVSGEAQLRSSFITGALTIAGAASEVIVDSCTINGTLTADAGSVVTLTDCTVASGAAVGISCGDSSTVNCYNSVVSSSNTNAVGGTGDFIYASVVFPLGSTFQGTLNATSGELLRSGTANLEGQLQIRAQTVTDFAGAVTLSSGVATVANTNIAATDKIFFQLQDINGSTALGALTYQITPGSEFAVVSSQIGTPASTQTGDNGIYEYLIIRGT